MTPAGLSMLTWMDGWYKGDSDEAIIGTEVLVEDAKKFGTIAGRIRP
jgi:acid stress chaperone HdeB